MPATSDATTTSDRPRNVAQADRWNGRQPVEPSHHRRSTEDTQRCAYERYGKRCPLPGTVTAVGSVPARNDDQRATFWCWWHVPDQRPATAATRDEWDRWLAWEAREKFLERYPRPLGVR